jgi:drug/metabolite transporter (DMT)-like permease
LQTTTATNGLLMLSLAPIVILGGAAIVARRWPAPHQTTGTLLSIAGASLLITRGEFSTIDQTGLVAGDLWMLVAIVVWAAYSLLLRRRPADLPQNVALAASIAIALILLTPFLFFST